jgi:hypothetical protein
MPPRRRPRRGRPAESDRGALYPTLDLHGETAESARRLAERWLRDQRDSGERHVRLITGWGKHSPGPPVLRGEIENLLRELTGELVSSIELEGGGGAIRVELRRPQSAPSIRSRPKEAPSTDHTLRRAAEEALAELGIDPNPDLLNAEIRRIRAERQVGSE